MAPTSDERREVARRLRKCAKTVTHNPEYLWQRLEIAVNGWKFGDAVDDSYALNNDVFARLADLIDPSDYDQPHEYCPNCGCRVVSDDE